MRVKSQDQNGTREVLTHELSSLGSARPQIEPSPGPAHSAWRSRSCRGKGESCSTLVYGGNLISILPKVPLRRRSQVTRELQCTGTLYS